MIVIAAKAADVAGAAAAARRMMGEGSVVVTIQNGLGSADVVAAELGGELGAGSLMVGIAGGFGARSEEHTSELQSLMRISYAVFCLKKKTYLSLFSFFLFLF